MSWAHCENRYGDERVSAACGLFGFIDTTGARVDGSRAVTALLSMRERGNGLGAGYAAYGIYPELSAYYALHAMCQDARDRVALQEYLGKHLRVIHDEPIPTAPASAALRAPVLWRFFVEPLDEDTGAAEDDEVVRHVMHINASFEGAFVFSSGKDMGIFKGVGHPEEIAEFYRVHDYHGYLWTAHNRFPTNTPGWWGGAHPFGLLDWSVVHNGEISSYGINRRYLETCGYRCTMQTDTEVVAYAADLVMRRHGLSPRVAAAIFASPLWEEIADMPEKARATHTALRQTYGSLLLNGPFTIIVARSGQMIGLADRIRLRPLVAAISGGVLYVSSELSAIHLVQHTVDWAWTPAGGEPVIGALGVRPMPPAAVDAAQVKHVELAHV